MKKSKPQEVAGMFNCNIIYSWGNLIRFGLAVSHAPMPSPTPNQEEQCWETSTVSKKLLALTWTICPWCLWHKCSQWGAGLRWDSCSPLEILNLEHFFLLLILSLQGMWLDRRSLKLSHAGVTFTTVRLFRKIRESVLCRSMFRKDGLWLRTHKFFSLDL